MSFKYILFSLYFFFHRFLYLNILVLYVYIYQHLSSVGQFLSSKMHIFFKGTMLKTSTCMSVHQRIYLFQQSYKNTFMRLKGFFNKFRYLILPLLLLLIFPFYPFFFLLYLNVSVEFLLLCNNGRTEHLIQVVLCSFVFHFEFYYNGFNKNYTGNVLIYGALLIISGGYARIFIL